MQGVSRRGLRRDHATTILRHRSRPLIMGILNLTPDSFSDGGCHDSAPAAVSRALEMLRQGADIIDVGGESTRPGAAPVPAEEQRRRVIDAIALIRDATLDAPPIISIDTTSD
ncbi:MAG: dihydropteroate synthase, partial [Thiohalocapsa sp.]